MSIREWLPLSILAISTAVMPLLSADLRELRSIAGVFPPWWTSRDVVTAAGAAGSIVRLGTLPFIVVVRSDSSDVAARLKASGALFNFDPLGISGCFTR